MKQRGFTLIELLVAVAVVAILAAVALPSYTGQVRRAKRVEAKTALMSILQAQEKLRANCPEYAGALGLADTCAASASVLNAASRTPSGLYNLELSGATPTGFVATATAVPGSGQDKDGTCAVLVLRMSQGAVTTLPASCW